MENKQKSICSPPFVYGEASAQFPLFLDAHTLCAQLISDMLTLIPLKTNLCYFVKLVHDINVGEHKTCGRWFPWIQSMSETISRSSESFRMPQFGPSTYWSTTPGSTPILSMSIWASILSWYWVSLSLPTRTLSFSGRSYLIRQHQICKLGNLTMNAKPISCCCHAHAFAFVVCNLRCSDVLHMISLSRGSHTCLQALAHSKSESKMACQAEYFHS